MNKKGKMADSLREVAFALGGPDRKNSPVSAHSSTSILILDKVSHYPPKE